MAPLTTILFVDDEHDVGVVADIALTRIGGFDVTVCASGHAALDHLAEHQADLVLLDVMMPGLDGPSTLERMRHDARTARTPVAFVTAAHQPRDLTRYRLLGVAGVIAKPFDPMALPSQVQNIWDALHGAPSTGPISPQRARSRSIHASASSTAPHTAATMTHKKT